MAGGGVVLAAIQGLNRKPNEKDAEIQALKQSVAELKETLTHLTQKNQLKDRDMKTGLKIVLMTLAFTALVARAQTNYTIDWHTIDGGGGTSTGNVYSVSGTIGQPDASGAMTGGNYSLTGGFWSVIGAVQLPGSPLLTITITGPSTVVVSWPSPSTGWNLQQNTDLGTTIWVTPLETVNDNGTNRFIIVNPPTGNRFYRLKN